MPGAPTSTRPTAQATPDLRVVATRLVVVASPDAGAVGRVALVSPEPVVLGRAPHAGGPLAIADPELSREHALFEPDGPGAAGAAASAWRVVDRESRNGVYLDGARVTRAALTHGCVLRVGATLLVYERLAVLPDEPFEPESGALLGRSVAVQRLRAEIGRVAGRPVSVLVLGESGAGKELVAEELHRRSGRPGAFVPVNCGALPEALVESELFGHVAGAFTGADRARPGLFAAARRGTLFLDEVGEMPAAMQPKLLRALATGEVRPVGGTEPVRVDVRVVAATNRVALEEAVGEGTFRGDLYARLAGWTIVVPPLRERREDVLALARRFLEREGATTAIGPDAAEALLLHGWPYNVRELEQIMAQSAVRASGAPSVELAHLPPALAAPLATRGAAPSAAPPPLELLVGRDATPGREELEIVLRRLEGNMARVAEYFRKERRQVYRWVERHGLDPESFRHP